jgi:hypothetical protein
MFKVGEYSQDEAKSIAGYLKDAGLKVDIRGLVRADARFAASRQGKLSEIKEKDDDYENHERFLAALKAAMEKGPTQDNFKDLFLTELDADWERTVEKLNECQHSYEELDEETRQSIVEPVVEYAIAIDFAFRVFDINKIKLGEPINGRLDDPVIRIPVGSEDIDSDDPTIRRRMEVDMAKSYEVLIDEFHTPFYREIDEDFKDEYPDEYQNIRALGLIMHSLIENPEKGKIDIEDFADRCMIDLGDRDVISIDASLVAEEIAESLEKNGIIKMKGSKIKWKA